MYIDLFIRTLESFIRAKYEQRKWIAKEWIPTEITVPIDVSVVSCDYCLDIIEY
jgi:hypothetical protein